nr:reverse transcriptase domain-containing protein [Tanacetum cinerariifolium]
MPNNVKTYDESDDPEDHLKIFQGTAKVERWAIPTWCHMFNSTFNGSARVWFDDVPLEYVDTYDDLKKAFLANFPQQKKCIKDPVEIHHIKQREEESTKDFMQRFKAERDEDGAKGPMIIEIEIGGHFIHRIYVDGVLASEIRYEHYFNRLHPKVKNEMVPATAPHIGFSEEIIWPMGQILMPIKIGDAEHFTYTRMNIMVVRSPSPYNGIIGRPRVRKIQAVPSTAHGMLKFLASGGILTLQSSRIIPLECTMVSGPEAPHFDVNWAAKKRIKVDNIVCRFGLPGEIISDNGKQFMDNPFKDWCEKLCIRQHFAFVKHPQANVLVERANKSLEEGIKARLDERSKDWIKEISHVLWAHRTMIKSSNGYTPFLLTYKMKAIIQEEIDMPTLRTTKIDMVQNDEALKINLDLLEERREQAAIRDARSKEKMEKYYNSKVRNTSFKPGDLVYRNNDASHAKDSGKLSPKWEGPYEVTKAPSNGAYKLRDRNGNLLPRTWNVCNLKTCYVHEM